VLVVFSVISLILCVGDGQKSCGGGHRIAFLAGLLPDTMIPYLGLLPLRRESGVSSAGSSPPGRIARGLSRWAMSCRRSC
jgi:hypothetical protein